MRKSKEKMSVWIAAAGFGALLAWLSLGGAAIIGANKAGFYAQQNQPQHSYTRSQLISRE
jgi:type II secretory pathway component PulM